MSKASVTKTDLRVGGAPEGFDGKILAELARDQGGPVLHISRDDRRAASMADALAFFAADLPVLTFPHGTARLMTASRPTPPSPPSAWRRLRRSPMGLTRRR